MSLVSFQDIFFGGFENAACESGRTLYLGEDWARSVARHLEPLLSFCSKQTNSSQTRSFCGNCAGAFWWHRTFALGSFQRCDALLAWACSSPVTCRVIDVPACTLHTSCDCCAFLLRESTRSLVTDCSAQDPETLCVLSVYGVPCPPETPVRPT